MRRILVTVLCLGITALLSGLSFAQGVSTQQDAIGRIEVSSGGVLFQSNVAYDWARLTVRKHGEGMVFNQRFEAADSLSWGLVSDAGATLTDGTYVYEFLLARTPERDTDGNITELFRPMVTGGVFAIRNGVLQTSQEAAARAEMAPTVAGDIVAPLDVVVNDDQIVEGSVCSSSTLNCADGEVFSVTGSTGVAELKAKGTQTSIIFEDTNGDDFEIAGDANRFTVKDLTGATTPFTIEAGAPNNSLFITDTGQIGMGTSNPDPDLGIDALHVVSVKTVIRMENTGSGTTWRIGDLSDGAFSFIIHANGSGGPLGNVFLISDTNGYVGIKTGDTNPLAWTPSAPLHLYKADAGDLSFRLDNQGNATTAAFNFAVNQFGAFTVNNTATSGQEFSVRQRLDAAGTTMSVQGSVEGTQFISTSSRELKTDFAELDTSAVLNSLVNLPMTSWRYKNGTEDRHFGLMAEDFKEAFGLGDGEHISTVDADGVAIAAIQGLHQVVQDKDAEIEDLKERIRRLEALVGSIAGSMENE